MTNAQNYSDERIAKRASQGSEKQDRIASDRPVKENRDNSDSVRLEERLSILRDVNTKLPQLPEIPGYHTCWLTTTNQSDSIEYRMRLGYELVKPSEIPGFTFATQQSGDVLSDRIQINEMVAAKISKELVESYVKHVHHDLPLEQMNNLRRSVSVTEDGRGRKVGYTGRDRDGEFSDGVSDGFRLLSREKRASFEGVL